MVELHFPAGSVHLPSIDVFDVKVINDCIAVFALSTIQFGKELESSFFKVLGTVRPLPYPLCFVEVLTAPLLDHVCYRIHPLGHCRSGYRP